MFGKISFPIAAELYLRQKDIDQLKGKYAREFQTKTAMAVAIVKRLVPLFQGVGKKIDIIVDGGYVEVKDDGRLVKRPRRTLRHLHAEGMLPLL